MMWFICYQFQALCDSICYQVLDDVVLFVNIILHGGIYMCIFQNRISKFLCVETACRDKNFAIESLFHEMLKLGIYTKDILGKLALLCLSRHELAISASKPR